MIKPAAMVLVIASIALPHTGYCDDTNSASSLFGVTVTQTVSKAEQQFELGHAYYTGDGVKKDLPRAIECFKKAAELGHAQAQFNLGLCYMQGTGVKQSDKDAEKWFKKAADQGIKEAFYPLGICYYNLEQYSEAYAWALVCESNGDPRLKKMFDPMFSKDEIAAGKARFEELKKASGKTNAKPE